MNNEAYLNGEHNGGVFNHFNLNSYGYCYGNPVLYVDPNGKQTVPGPIRGIGDGIVRVFNSIFTPSDGEVEETSNDVHKMFSSPWGSGDQDIMGNVKRIPGETYQTEELNGDVLPLGIAKSVFRAVFKLVKRYVDGNKDDPTNDFKPQTETVAEEVIQDTETIRTPKYSVQDPNIPHNNPVLRERHEDTVINKKDKHKMNGINKRKKEQGLRKLEAYKKNKKS